MLSLNVNGKYGIHIGNVLLKKLKKKQRLSLHLLQFKLNFNIMYLWTTYFEHYLKNVLKYKYFFKVILEKFLQQITPICACNIQNVCILHIHMYI